MTCHRHHSPRGGLEIAHDGGQQRGLARARRAGDQHIEAVARPEAQEIGDRLIEHAAGDHPLIKN
jgi:hypothetical protein